MPSQDCSSTLPVSMLSTEGTVVGVRWSCQHRFTACVGGLLATCLAAVALVMNKSGGGQVSIAYNCNADLELGPVLFSSSKGIAIDDTTFENCISHIPRLWPNSKEKLTSFRLFKAWDKSWDENLREQAWTDLREIVLANNAKVLVGTQVTCDEIDDDRDWALVLKLLTFLGREHVMGVAVGNEMELLQFKASVTRACIRRIWGGGYFTKKLTQRVADLDNLPGFHDVTITSVFGAKVLSGVPFEEDPGAMVNSFLSHAVGNYGSRWAFTFNIYPYYDPGNRLDPGSDSECTHAIKRGVCFGKTCNLPTLATVLRDRVQQLTGNPDDTFWLGETGWSTPMASTLPGANPSMALCPEFSSEETFQTFYRNFLHWDLSTGSLAGPDHVFYFTLRDSNNFGVEEHFGLISGCDSSECKLQEPLPDPNGTVMGDLEAIVL